MNVPGKIVQWICLVASLICNVAIAQEYNQRGFVEARETIYPQQALNDPSRSVGEVLFRYEASLKLSSKIQIDGATDLRTDSHHETNRSLRVSWWDREERRPAAEVRRLSATYHSGGLSVELGKQFVRWGKTDILNPTDRFAPRDYLTVLDNDFLGITAGRIIYERGSETVDLVWQPRQTPSRIPLFDQRWIVPLPVGSGVQLARGPTGFPKGSAGGIRWSHTGTVELSASYYEGYNHLPLFQPTYRFVANGVPPGSGVVIPPGPPLVTAELDAFYPHLRMIGADASVPLQWVTLKSEAGYFTSKDTRADEYADYVVQLERQSGELMFIGGYSGESVTKRGTLSGSFAPDRGITRTLLGSAHYTIDSNRSLAFETAVRQNLDGIWSRAEYSQAVGRHWRATADLTLIRGKPRDFLGQYRRNSHLTLVLRYSF